MQKGAMYRLLKVRGEWGKFELPQRKNHEALESWNFEREVINSKAS